MAMVSLFLSAVGPQITAVTVAGNGNALLRN
jgi:hypothetical protein